MRCFVFTLSFLVMLIPIHAHASFWLECAVYANVKLDPETEIYSAKILDGEVTDGHAKPGQPCVDNVKGKTIEIKIDGNPPEGKNIRLKYNFYNGIGDDGVVNEESWAYWPAGIGDVLPW